MEGRDGTHWVRKGALIPTSPGQGGGREGWSPTVGASCLPFPKGAGAASRRQDSRECGSHWLQSLNLGKAPLLTGWVAALGAGGSEWFGPGRELFKLMLNIPSIPKHEMGGDRPVTLQGVGPMTLTLALTHLSSQLLEA